MPREETSVRRLLEQQAVVTPVVRILLALTVTAGGIAFVSIGALVLFSTPTIAPPSPIRLMVLSAVMMALGIGFLWVGIRLLKARATSDRLLSPAGRRRCSLIVGALAVCSLALALETGSALFLLGAFGLLAFSYFLFPGAEIER